MLKLRDIQTARERIAKFVFQTPLERSSELDERGTTLFSKLETLQRTGSFKIRGALNKLLTLSKEGGVIAASMGNHAQGVALAAKLVGVSATVVMPVGAPLVKLENTRSFGATVLEEGGSIEESLATAKKLGRQRGLTLIPPFDDPAVIAGQGTIGLEILEKLPEVGEVVVPVGGGGLISGIAVAIKETRPGVVITGVQAKGANSAVLSFLQKTRVRVERPQTFADGIRVGEVGEICFAIIQKYVDRMVEVEEDEIASSVLALMDRSKAVVEGAAATTLAAVRSSLAGKEGRKTVLVLSGGNIDFTQISRILSRGLAETGRMARIRVLLPDVPGTLAGLLAVIKDEGANVLDIEHDRTFYNGPINSTQVRVTLETRGKDHVVKILNRIEGLGYKPEHL